jgi:U3 small nucleolar RNA-associated protein 18
MDVDTRMRDLYDMESSDSDEELQNPYIAEQEPDDNEKELEQLLFGGSRTIPDFSTAPSQQVATVDKDDNEVDEIRQTLQDDDLFFVDAEPDAAASKALQLAAEKTSDSDDDVTGEPAWKDSDDERVQVSIATSDRLRKLRVTEDEDMMNGKEYSRRLRRQYVFPCAE